VADLQALFGNAVLTGEIHHTLERLLILVSAKGRAFMADAADHVDVGHFGDHHAPSAHREIADVHQVPVISAAIGRVVLTHRRHGRAVRQGESTHGDRRE
jgi:hypothetical protein